MVSYGSLRLKKRYPLIKIKLEDEAREIPIVDNMFIDFNALIYRCVRVRRGVFRSKTTFSSTSSTLGVSRRYMKGCLNTSKNWWTRLIHRNCCLSALMELFQGQRSISRESVVSRPASRSKGWISSTSFWVLRTVRISN